MRGAVRCEVRFSIFVVANLVDQVFSTVKNVHSLNIVGVKFTNVVVKTIENLNIRTFLLGEGGCYHSILISTLV